VAAIAVSNPLIVPEESVPEPEPALAVAVSAVREEVWDCGGDISNGSGILLDAGSANLTFGPDCVRL